ncbi:MAG: hypothetical protein WC868_03375 [Bacteroidales bacterium]
MENNSQIIIYTTEKGELDESSTCKDFLQVQKEGNRAAGHIPSFKFHNRYFHRDLGLGAWNLGL